MGQHNNSEHDSNMTAASHHSKYTSHDQKSNAPAPFNLHSPEGAPDTQEEGDTTIGKKDAPAPFNAQKGKPIAVKGKGLSKGKTG